MAKCFDILNLDYFINVKLQFEACETAEELQALVNEVYAQVALLNSTLQAQVDALAPLLSLLTAPTNPAEVITWITNFIGGPLTLMLKPSVVLDLQVTGVLAQVAEMTALILEIQSLKFPTFTITIPSVAPFCTL